MVNILSHLSVANIWELLNTIPDPDIPVISITELGLVKNVDIDKQNKVTVTLTPSYSGCPAMSVFQQEIKNTLLQNGAAEVEIKISYSPAWSTDLLSNATKEKMKHYGIAPPENACDTSQKLFSAGVKKVTCPLCNHNNTSLISQFGSTPCKSLWHCQTCNQPFEYFKCH